MKHSIIIGFAIALLCVSCGGSSSGTDRRYDDSFDGTMLRYQDQMDEAAETLKYFSMDKSSDHFSNMVSCYEGLVFDYDIEELDVEQKKEARRVRFMMDSVRTLLGREIEAGISQVHTPIVELDDHLLDTRMTTPVYLKRGSKLFLDIETSGTAVVKIYNADAKSLMKTYSGKKQIHDSIAIANSAIYLLEVTPKGSQYVNIVLAKSVCSVEMLGEEKSVTTEVVGCTSSDFMAQKVEGINMTNMFEEPRKITLRSQGKAFFSGSSRSVVAVKIPRGTSDLFYSLRISTDEGDRTEDGKFCENMQSTYKKVKFLGLPIYEKTGNKSSLIRELLNANVPPREEDAYCSMYVVKEASQAKKFQDGTPASEIRYDIDRSSVGTQSCNGCLNVKGMSTIYLCFENERFRYSNYLWLEVIAAVPQTEYYRNQYSVDQ